MNNLRILVMLALAVSPAAAQTPAVQPGQSGQSPITPASGVNSFYERGPGVAYIMTAITVEGEVESPGPVDLASLPLREATVKELDYVDGKEVFRGAYLVSGYSLYDILKNKAVKKAREDFKPETDLYVVVENAAGKKAVFSWGEIYYAADGFGAMVSARVRSVPMGKRDSQWPLPAGPRLVCSADLYNSRFITDPVKITVKSAPGEYPGARHQATYAPELRLVYGDKRAVVKGPGKAGLRTYVQSGYGHGTGFKGLKHETGFLFKDVLAGLGMGPKDYAAALVVVSAGDAYRAAFSLAEIMNRGDNKDFLLVDNGKTKDGRFSLFSAADFFVDRNVRSAAKAEILKI